jgi:hypothetical protein
LSFFCCCCWFSLVFSSFFPHGGHSVQGAMLIWPRVVCGSTTCHLAHLVVCFSWASRSWSLVSLFTVEWGCYAWAGSVEKSEFCLLLVVFPVRCISSVSPRFYFRKHTFCFLPLVAILESLKCLFYPLLKNIFFLLCVVVHAYNPSTEEAEAEGWWIWGQPGLHSEILSQKKPYVLTLCTILVVQLFSQDSEDIIPPSSAFSLWKVISIFLGNLSF